MGKRDHLEFVAESFANRADLDWVNYEERSVPSLPFLQPAGGRHQRVNCRVRSDQSFCNPALSTMLCDFEEDLELHVPLYPVSGTA